jgi:AcrR family transcriptional regulator
MPAPRTNRGWRTRQKVLDAAEQVFGTDGFHRASIVDITRTAGVGQGTFYLYFPSKEALFVELVRQMGHEMRRRLAEATAGLASRSAAEREGLRAFFEFVAQHPAMYRIVRECEFVDAAEFRNWYEELAEGYVRGIGHAMEEGEFRALDPEVVAYCLMGMGDFLGMKMVRWEGRRRVPARVLDTVMEVALHGLTNPQASRSRP